MFANPRKDESPGTCAFWLALLPLAAGITFVFYGGVALAFGQGMGDGSRQSQHADILRGTVLNAITHEPIGRALVFSSDNRFAMMTDDRGHFEFVVPRANSEQSSQTSGVLGTQFQKNGQFANSQVVQPSQPPPELQSRRPDSLRARKTGFLFSDREMQGVSVGSDQQDVTITLMPEAHIVGHVILPGSESAVGIKVDLYKRQVLEGRAHWESVGTTAARSDGEFRFADLSAGSYKVFTHELLDRDPVRSDPRAQLFGYPPVYYPAAADFASGAIIPLTTGETFQANLSPARREYYPVTLEIANSVAKYYPHIRVYRQGHEGPGYSLGYDSRQATIVGLLPNGTYTVQVAAGGPSSMTGSSNITVSGAPVSGVMVSLSPSSSLAVSVNEEFQHGRPQSTMTVRNELGETFTGGARRPNYLQVTLAPLDEFARNQRHYPRAPTGPDDDLVVFEHLPPGRYRVVVNGDLGYVASILAGATDLQREPLVVARGATPPEIEITVRDDGASVDGSITGPPDSANPVAFSGPQNRDSNRRPGAIYFLPVNDSGQFKEGWIDQNGNFQVQQLAPGTYRVLAFDHQQTELEYTSEEKIARYVARSQVISVVAGQVEHIRLPLITGDE